MFRRNGIGSRLQTDDGVFPGRADRRFPPESGRFIDRRHDYTRNDRPGISTLPFAIIPSSYNSLTFMTITTNNRGSWRPSSCSCFVSRGHAAVAAENAAL